MELLPPMLTGRQAYEICRSVFCGMVSSIVALVSSGIAVAAYTRGALKAAITVALGGRYGYNRIHVAPIVTNADVTC